LQRLSGFKIKDAIMFAYQHKHTLADFPELDTIH